ncbi:uncharacterized protein LOC123312307 isoform X1 [Coccinella septempunctata]|uniref:uncharacterized protein LOC123312307 isoform X1 n=1 Tax=Coccinella septempunctata TaxID=41139 RepID=UPI001D073909|nr:uncharacterized protein LOC123312307 isoform X1 [Coccinella septempunctata]XP_044752606.1 uncharacterized protein LOC123312307 isoform X1 [Coccinella septempunctata]
MITDLCDGELCHLHGSELLYGVGCNDEPAVQKPCTSELAQTHVLPVGAGFVLYVNLCFRISKAFCWSSPHFHRCFFLSSRVSGETTLEKFSMNRRYQLATPRNRRNSRTVLGAGNDTMDATLSGSVQMPSEVTTCPRYFRDFRTNSHLSGLRRKLASLSRLNTSLKFSMCSSKVSPRTTISSR